MTRRQGLFAGTAHHEGTTNTKDTKLFGLRKTIVNFVLFVTS